MNELPNTSMIQEPKQERSRLTMEQLLEAAAHILESKTFEELTISEVVERAGSSVGAFYGRFQDKEALLEMLDERFFEQLEGGVADLLGSYIENLSLTELVDTVTRFLVDIYSQDRGVLRSLHLKAKLSDDIRFKQREQRAWEELFPHFQKLLLRQQQKIGHPDPVFAIRFGFQQMFFTMREFVLWESQRGIAPYDEDVLVAELSKAYLAYLQA